ncbi:MAG: hypothetical protein WA667_19300 [Candidatus Nitrosopolaris sp.]
MNSENGTEDIRLYMDEVPIILVGKVAIQVSSSRAIKRIKETEYVVKSQNGSGDEVRSTDLGWVCSWPDRKFRGVKCSTFWL